MPLDEVLKLLANRRRDGGVGKFVSPVVVEIFRGNGVPETFEEAWVRLDDG